VLAVGDCAHALPAVFGQAGAQAIEDAVVLGELLRQEGAPAAIAQRLVARRFPRVQQVAAIAMQAARWQAAPEGDTDLLRLARSLDAVVHEPA
jgi:2-polyprenyl-6-methoxyphenol hydroxylase-like FAD-dependent oxidoreductase